MNSNFEKLNLRPELTTNLSELSFHEMTPIQELALPYVLEGKDLIAQAKTGSGKTVAFGLGLLNSLNTLNPEAQSLVLCPTRELAEQVATELRKLARMIKNVKVLTITGGTGYYHQESSLDHGAHIIVGTPGRVAKLIKTGFLFIQDLQTLVLDEADRMLDMGFFDEIMGITKQLNSKRQTLLFSATFPEEILNLSKRVQKDAQKLEVDSSHNKGEIEQYFFEVPGHKEKNEALLKVLGQYQPERLIIFCKTKVITDKLAKFLRSKNILAESIHGDLEQRQRTSVLTRFSNRSLSILVSTDVAARGIDIKDLGAVINYDLCNDPEDYIHRIGRTGRAGKTGLAISFYVEQEEPKVEFIRKHMNLSIAESEGNLPAEEKGYGLTPPMRTLYVSGGKKDKLRPGDLLGALVKEAGLDPEDVGDISIFPTLSYVALKLEKVEQAIDRLSTGRIKNRNFKVGLAK